MTAVTGQSECLNCGEPLAGRFCANCGQRVIPAYPTVREFIGDTWEEMSGYDGRIVRSIRALFRRPGAMTKDVLEGRRARYVSAVRLYLFASVLYFVVASATPELRVRDDVTGQTRTIKIGLWSRDDSVAITEEDRAEIERLIAKSPWYLKPLMEDLRDDPDALRQGLVTAVPKALFLLVPVFAAILALFYRRRAYMQHLVFALHLHAVIFISLALARAVQVTGSVVLAAAVSAASLLFIALYALRGLRYLYGSRWHWTAVKAAGVFLVYAGVSLPVLLAAAIWASWIN